MGFPNEPVVAPFLAASYPRSRKALANVMAGLGQMKLLCIGDSTTWGSLGGGANPPGPGGSSYPSQLQILLSKYVANADIGLSVPEISAPFDARWTAPGWTTNFFGFAQLLCWQGAPAVADITYTPGTNCDTFDVYYVTAPGLGTFNVNIDGGANTPVNTSTASGIAKVTIAGAVGSAHVLHVGTVTVNNVLIVGIEARLSTASLIRVGNAGAPGLTATNWSDLSAGVGGSPYQSIATLTAYAPDLTIIALGGINDGNTAVPFASYQAAIQKVIQTCQLSGDVILMSSPPSLVGSGSASLAFEQSATPFLANQASQKSLGFSDVFTRFSPGAASNLLGYYADAFHPSGFGYMDIASAAYHTITSIFA